MQREQRLRRNSDFQRVRETAPRSWAHPLLVLYAASNELDLTRVGVTAGKRVGKAVVRNRARRRIREAVRLRYPRLRVGHDLVFIARASSAEASWDELSGAVDALIGRAGLWAPRPDTVSA